ncbi:MAG: leucyl aminopeptidase [Hoeflea sp.]|uniref:leucyl aminopeptidase n=1 Tax=Hoeflea sp. TaxID=1940281 RepID=UPI001D4D7C7B|nr:leucyl aminopeptidase [Hoeflea sp.]MBU4530107.1 leucyl aminopeptidase [Alphaproteobacteria bacterium]MBU4542608.1 leucyl aminopeptidase [Alphaproteobacteria bacterium]MBU4551289.1 leucyl aminopeptidase [Alphaproteobacteria bacterium]MBV1723112.1 leucyl aminopeptidase [Hoeflea sp.]MBV1760123.1 leucyl aminopeptidase [Hoeflea sp.]
MSISIEISFSKTAKVSEGLVVALGSSAAPVSAAAKTADPAGQLDKAVKVAGFTGKSFSTVDVFAPVDAPADRIALVGTGDPEKLSAHEWMRVGGKMFSLIGKASKVTVLLGDADVPSTEAVADVALGLLMRSYSFDTYKTKKGEDDDNGSRKVSVVFQHDDAGDCKKAFATRHAIWEGVELARNLVNEPANVLGPVEFADRAKELESLGVEVEILTEKEMKKLKMEALLGVSLGSPRPPRLAIMRWQGAKPKDKPVAFVGKGVVFDTGGVSIKPAAGMEDMKGDMGGAAAVIGLMHVLAARKAKVNAVGIIGLVENAVDGAAQRPGDIVRSMSGQTIEVINTDAEGRLVLCDALTYCQERFKPAIMINLATLTGAIIVALGPHHAGLFSNNDDLSQALTKAGEVTEERVWRMPLGSDYDKMIDSKFADMKNTGGRHAGAITAAQFLKRFVKDTPWAHLDIAGTAMGSPSTDINQSWASGFGVRLLDELVRANYES